MKLINFVPPQIRERQIRRRIIGASAVSAIIAGAAIAALWFSLSYDIQSLKVKEVENNVTVAKKLPQQIITPDILTRETAIAALSQSDINWGRVFKLTGTILPKDIQLSSFSLSNASGATVLSITGSAPSNYSFASFVQSLNSSSLITGVKVNGYAYTPINQLVTFSISASVPVKQINYASH